MKKLTSTIFTIAAFTFIVASTGVSASEQAGITQPGSANVVAPTGITQPG
ncbi:hypothetical protein [Bacillus sp. Marseille-P3800]|nr:hypothetical protein [Bacillus sp. Marseille-P3800]